MTVSSMKTEMMKMTRMISLEDIGRLLGKELRPEQIYFAGLSAQMGAAITAERCYRNMSINEFAKLLGITEEKLKKIEDGGYNFTIRDVSDICSKLDMTPMLEFKEGIKNDEG